MVMKPAGKVALVREAGHESDLCERKVRLRDQVLCPPYAAALDIFDRCGSGRSLEDPREMEAAYIHEGGKISETNRMVQMVRNVLLDTRQFTITEWRQFLNIGGLKGIVRAQQVSGERAGHGVCNERLSRVFGPI